MNKTDQFCCVLSALRTLSSLLTGSYQCQTFLQPVFCTSSNCFSSQIAFFMYLFLFLTAIEMVE